MKLSEFLVEIRKAVNSAANALTERNIEFFNKYFEEKRISETETVRVPKTVRMDYPIAADDGSIKMKRLDVPVISLIPVYNCTVKLTTPDQKCRNADNWGYLLTLIYLLIQMDTDEFLKFYDLDRKHFDFFDFLHSFRSGSDKY